MVDIDNVNREKSLLAAWVLDGEGSGKSLDWRGIENWSPIQGILWVHLDRNKPKAREWAKKQSGVDSLISEALFEEDSRPRSTLCENGQSLMFNLRTPNLNPKEEVDDMLSVRFWSNGQLIITTRRLPIKVLHDIDDQLKKKQGPKDASDFLKTLCSIVTERIVTVLGDLENELENIERSLIVAQAPSIKLQAKLIVLQRKIINFRRYVTLQPDVLNDLQNEAPDFIKEKNLRQIRDTAQKMVHAQSWIDTLYDRAFNCQQQIYTRLTVKAGRTTFLLTIVASVFLPLTFLTGLLGTNIGGIPGASYPYAFWILIGFCCLIIAIQLFLLRFLKWF